MQADLFAVVVTAALNMQRIEAFFHMTYQKAHQLDCAENLVLIESFENLAKKAPTKLELTQPPISRAPRPMEFPLKAIAQDVTKAARGLPDFTLSSQLFVVLDERSAIEDNGLVVQIRDDSVETVRVHFDTIASELTRISIMTFNIGETTDLARNAPGKVFRTVLPEPHQRGGPAPRKKLGE